MARVLVIEKSGETSLKDLFEPSDEIICFNDTMQLVQRIRKIKPELVLIGFGVPEGFEICRGLKSDSKISSIPVLLIGDDPSGDIVRQAFECGADDYLVRPIHRTELQTRAYAKLRLIRHAITAANTLESGDIQFDIVKRIVIIPEAGQYTPIRLSPSEFQLLLLLCKNQGKILKREEIYKELAHKNSKKGYTRVIDAQISSIRRKSHFFQQSIESIHGVGYRISLEN